MSGSAIRVRADLALALTAVLWGLAFVAQRSAMEFVGPVTFNALRYSLAALVFTPLVFRSIRKSLDLKHLKAGAILGVLCFTGGTLQQIGMVSSGAGKAAFITGLYVVLTPLFLSFIWRERISILIHVSAIIAAFGMGLLSLTDEFSIEWGDFLVFLCAIVFSFHIIFVARFVRSGDTLLLAWLQNVIVAVFSWIAVSCFESFSPQQSAQIWRELLYAGIFSSGIAFALQLWAQKYSPPSDASLIVSLESIFALAGGWYFLSESMTGRQLSGCAIILAGVFLSQIPVMFQIRPSRRD